ncbi:MAG: T9SS type A sorting domain-containing protein [Flavobacteriales bacterium]|nr:T9SS type A sorting domain-containing protein [Flavobacteriales bacterium]MBP6697688.1 T9SS type A sorting domain-containing protein [Flavobacteriales bacterium]
MAEAQSPYRPFPAMGAGWVVAAGGLHFNCNPTEVFESTKTFVVGDTVSYGGVDHVEVWMQEQGSWTVVGPPAGGTCPTGGIIDVPWHVAMHLRQDVAARRVYAGPDDGTDLLYDFSIGLGTYPQTVDNYAYPDLKVVALDSVALNDGYHRTWVLGMDYGAGVQDSAFCTIIEGVGSTYGPLPFAGLSTPFEFSDTLTCFNDGTNTIFPLGAGACDLAMGTDHLADRTLAPISAYPSPSSGEIHLRGTLPEAGTYAILDLTGKTVERGTFPGSAIDISALRNSIYFLRIMDRTGQVVGHIRFVKE